MGKPTSVLKKWFGSFKENSKLAFTWYLGQNKDAFAKEKKTTERFCMKLKKNISIEINYRLNSWNSFRSLKGWGAFNSSPKNMQLR